MRTTIDLKLQKMASEAIAKVLPPEIGPTAALVTLDPRTGAVLAMVGGRNYHQSQFNLATQGERQPGSSFKPFVLAAALKSGISPATTFVSQPVTIDAGGRLWQVNNYESDYNGTIDLRSAIAYSDNSVFAQLTNVVGPANVAATATVARGRDAAQRLLLDRPRRRVGDAARHGARVRDVRERRLRGSTARIFENEPRVVACLEDDDGRLQEGQRERRRIACSRTGRRTPSTSCSRASSATAPARRRGSPGYPVAGKTGTTENYGDAWFVGYTPDLVTAVWVGYPDELRPMLTEYHGRPVAGGTYPALIWKAFMEKALPYRLEGTRRGSFAQPPYLYASPAARRPPRPEARARQRALQQRDDGAALHVGAARRRALRRDVAACATPPNGYVQPPGARPSPPGRDAVPPPSRPTLPRDGREVACPSHNSVTIRPQPSRNDG